MVKMEPGRLESAVRNVKRRMVMIGIDDGIMEDSRMERGRMLGFWMKGGRMEGGMKTG